MGAGERQVHLAPGLAYEDENGQPDVMRGEEVEILGIASSGGRLIVLPGSHSKWAIVDRGRILSFKTFVTGELFAAVKDHTLAGAFARVAEAEVAGRRLCARRRRKAQQPPSARRTPASSAPSSARAACR